MFTVVPTENVPFDDADEIAARLRTTECVAINYTARKYPDIVKLAQKFGIKKIVVLGATEVANKQFEIREV